MTDSPPPAPPPAAQSPPADAAYEVIRQRLQANCGALRERAARLDARRQEVFGRIESRLLQADRVTTPHNCIPRDMVQLGNGQFLFGFNVQFGLKKEIELADVFAIYVRDETAGAFREAPLEPLSDPRFVADFKRLYNVYERATFSKFSLIGSQLYMVFRTGSGAGDIAVFKWTFGSGSPAYVDGRAEAEFRKSAFPPPFEFRWKTPDREAFRYGDHPHVSIEDRVFVECIGGDLTIKVEDNTATGEGVYSEPVEDRHQKVDDAEIAYAVIGHLIVLKLRPYKEPHARFFIFNEKLQSVVRVDSLGQSCALLPEDHGLVFPDGYYLATGDLKVFEAREEPQVLERVLHAPNGEDSLYVFFGREAGIYTLLPYRLIEQHVEERLVCHGFSLFPNGQLVSFRGDDAPQKHHQIQLRQTPFYQTGFEPAGRRDAFLYQVGNKDVVRCLAEIHEVLTLAGRDAPYAELYSDVVRRCTAMLDAYTWLGSDDGFQLDEALRQLRETADKAVEEFAKVRRLQQEAVRRLADLGRRCESRVQEVRRAGLSQLEEFVHHLAALRHLRGELITLREVRYVDLAQLAALEQGVAAQLQELSARCVQFLLRPESLDPYRRQADGHLAAVPGITKAAEGRKLEKAVADAGGELEMLIEIVNNLGIEDATETTRILDGITAVYATLNQVKAALKKHLQALVASEGAAQFNAQLKLLGQSAASFLDLCDTPAKCDEYLNRLSVQLEELEGAFAGFEEYAVQLAERRTEFYEAFEQRKIALVEQRNRQTQALMSAAERILKVIQNRLAGFRSVEEIHTYLASDLMAAKIRDTLDRLLALGDAVKADDLQGRFKTLQQEAVRQLKDRQELFVEGADVIQLGKHRFNVNTQPLDLTLVLRDGHPHFHLTGTQYFERVTDEDYLATRAVWDQEVVSENSQVYRAEYLAWRILESLETNAALGKGSVEDFLSRPEEQRLEFVREFMAQRYQDNYAKGLHDLDGARILSALAATQAALHLARYPPDARACAWVYWQRFCPEEIRAHWTARLEAFGECNRLFPGHAVQQSYVAALQSLLADFLRRERLYPEDLARDAGEYLYHELIRGDGFTVTREAEQAAAAFQQHLVARSRDDTWSAAREAMAGHPASELELIRDWVRGFLQSRGPAVDGGTPPLEEAAALLFCGDAMPRKAVEVASRHTLDGMRGAHPRLQDNTYHFDYLDFVARLRQFDRDAVPQFEAYHRLKGQLLERERTRLKLEEFRPRVLSSFVRNQLVDRVYLPLVGDNLAKQIGAAGASRRTDQMGLLLLVSPPGYGKTTLLEYVASRLGVVFIKINGPALGHGVTSLDPQEAPNAAAREEVQKLNLALEMGDNVMVCVDDIQHCSAEFLQKFISLCDGQRKMEGVWRGQPRTYDLRGRKVVVAMAGNPYTESGQKFKIPDMLANRADTYNLGDIIGGNAEWFRASYLENALTSNPVLAPLAARSQSDVRAFIRAAEQGERAVEGLEGSYSAHEAEEILSVLRKLAVLRDIVMRVNAEYIASAAQADEFRTEPPFKLQGSYRNMNRLAEKVVAILNEEEVRALVLGHYRSESQTLTTGAEANLLKLMELLDAQSPEEAARWEEIKKTFRRNQYTRGADTGDPVDRVVAQLALFQAGLESIQATIASHRERPATPVALDLAALEKSLEPLRATLEERLARVGGDSPPGAEAALISRTSAGLEVMGAQLQDGLKALGADLTRAFRESQDGAVPSKVESLSHEMEMMHSTLATLKDLAAQQRDHLRSAQELLATRARQGTLEVEVTQDMLANERAFLEQLQRVLEGAQRTGNQ